MKYYIAYTHNKGGIFIIGIHNHWDIQDYDLASLISFKENDLDTAIKCAKEFAIINSLEFVYTGNTYNDYID